MNESSSRLCGFRALLFKVILSQMAPSIALLLEEKETKTAGTSFMAWLGPLAIGAKAFMKNGVPLINSYPMKIKRNCLNKSKRPKKPPIMKDTGGMKKPHHRPSRRGKPPQRQELPLTLPGRKSKP